MLRGPMRRRSRIKLIVVLAVVGIPLLAGVGLVLFVALGGVERRIEEEFAARLPGTLRLGRVEVAATDHVLIHDVRLYGAGGGEALASVDRVGIRGGLLDGSIDVIDLEGLHLRVDRDFLAWLRQAAARPSDGASPGFAVRARGEIAVAQRLIFEALDADLRFAARGIDGHLRASFKGKPVALDLASEAIPDRAERRTVIDCGSLTVDVADTFAALQGLDVLDTPAQLLTWLPASTSLAGTRFEVDPLALTVSGSLAAVWPQGSLTSAVTLDGAGLSFTALHATDAGLGRAEGSLAIAFATRDLALTLGSWAPGPRLGLPERLPRGDLLTLLPQAGLRIRGGSAQSVQARFHNAASTAWIEGSWEPGRPIRVDGGGLPLTLAQGFLPKDWAVESGAIQGLTASWDGRLERAVLDVSDLALRAGSWQASDLDGSIVVEPLESGYRTRLDVAAASVVHRGTLTAGEIEVTVVDLAGLADHVRGPRPLLACAGFLKLIATVGIEAGASGGGRILHFGCAGLGVEGLLRDVAISGTGTYAWSAEGLETRIDGQCFAAELGLPGRWIDLAQRQPRFTATMISEAETIRIEDLLARAAHPDGRPQDAGFTAGINGTLDRTFNGSFAGVIDRIDLGYLSERLGIVPLPAGTTLTGESAVTWDLAIATGTVQGLEGVALPLGVDLAFIGGKVAIDGIDGAIRFTLKPLASAP